MKNNKGLTLVELVVSVALLSMIILGAISILDFGGKSYNSLDKTGQIQTDAYRVLTAISTEVRECRRIQVSDDHKQLDLVDRNTALKFEANSLNHINLMDGSIIEVMASNIQTLEFIPLTDANGVLTVGVDISIGLAEEDEKYTLKTEVYTRAR